MPESVLEAAWRTKRQVKILYNSGATRALQAQGHVIELKPGSILFRALGGFDFDLAMVDIIQVDGRNPFMADSPDAPEPAKERIVHYVSGMPPRPNEHLSAYGQVFELEGGHLVVETPDGREITIPRQNVLRIENPTERNPYPQGERLTQLRKLKK